MLPARIAGWPSKMLDPFRGVQPAMSRPVSAPVPTAPPNATTCVPKDALPPRVPAIPAPSVLRPGAPAPPNGTVTDSVPPSDAAAIKSHTTHPPPPPDPPVACIVVPVRRSPHSPPPPAPTHTTKQPIKLLLVGLFQVSLAVYSRSTLAGEPIRETAKEPTLIGC